MPAPNLVTNSEIWDAPTYYEVTGKTKKMRYEPVFYDRLETWLEFWWANTPLNWSEPLQIWSLGAYVPVAQRRSTGGHNAGRGFDLTAIYAEVDGTLTKVFDGRYDRWRKDQDKETVRRWYWATCASINYHFQSTIHYEYNKKHWNHIHIDNLVSAGGDSNFSPVKTATTKASDSQVKHVQACCTYIWDYPTNIDGKWGTTTLGNWEKVLTLIGIDGPLTTNQVNWQAFNYASIRFGTGAQTY